ncbi:MAG: oligosaccharide flippase family protein [Acidobacteriaceae bacterium]
MTPKQTGSSLLSRGAALHLRRLSANTALQIGGQLAPMIAGIVSVSLIYRNIGATGFGIFSIALSVLGLFSFLDLGLGRATVRFAARAFSGGDVEGAASITVQSILYLGSFALLLCVLGLVFSSALANNWIKARPEEHEVLRQCLILLAAAIPFGGLTSVFRSVLESRERFFAISVMQAAVGTGTYVLPLMLSYWTVNLAAIVAGAVACRVVGFVAFGVAAFGSWAEGFPWASVSFKAQPEFRQFSFWTVLSNILGAGIVYGDRALLVRMFGLAEIPFYNVPLELLGRAMITMNSAVTVVFPSLARFAGNKIVFGRLYVALATLLSAGLGIIFVVGAIATPAVLGLWLGSAFRVHSTLLVRIFLVGVAFQSFNMMSLASVNARGLAKPITLMHLVEVPLYFWALFQFGTHFGLAGIATTWAGRLVIEYFCFAAFQGHLAHGDDALRQWVGSAMGACNIAPVALVVIYGTAIPALIFCGAAVTVSTVWALVQLRDLQRDEGRVHSAGA